jgi:hypothetical protein
LRDRLLEDGPPNLVWTAYMRLWCREHGEVFGPRWRDVVETRPASPTITDFARRKPN